MEHMEFKRMVEGAERAVLFIHGIAGTPNHFHAFVSLVPNTVSVYNMLLDGHGKGVKEFSRTSMKKWEDQVDAAIKEMASTHKEIYIVAHSMGTLFAVEQAIDNEKIKKLFLLAAPVKLFIRPQMASVALKVYFNKIKPDDKIAIAAENSCGIKQDKNLLAYLGWVPRFLELFEKIRHVRNKLPQLNTHCIAYQSSFDEMVSLKSITSLKQNPCISVVTLQNSCHYYYDNGDFEFLLEEFKNFIKEENR